MDIRDQYLSFPNSFTENLKENNIVFHVGDESIHEANLNEEDTEILLSCLTEEGFVVKGDRHICNVCDGDGTVVNPSIDSHGISQEEFDEDPEFAEAYFSGVFNIACPRCKGNKLVLEVSDSNHKVVKAFLSNLAEEEENYRRMCMSEMRYGC